MLSGNLRFNRNTIISENVYLCQQIIAIVEMFLEDEGPRWVIIIVQKEVAWTLDTSGHSRKLYAIAAMLI